jgi:hypothetical protein
MLRKLVIGIYAHIICLKTQHLLGSFRKILFEMLWSACQVFTETLS